MVNKLKRKLSILLIISMVFTNFGMLTFAQSVGGILNTTLKSSSEDNNHSYYEDANDINSAVEDETVKQDIFDESTEIENSKSDDFYESTNVEESLDDEITNGQERDEDEFATTEENEEVHKNTTSFFFVEKVKIMYII